VALVLELCRSLLDVLFVTFGQDRLEGVLRLEVLVVVQDLPLPLFFVN